MSDINSVQLKGRLTKAPEFRNTQDGKQFVTFDLATADTYKNKDTGKYEKKETNFHHVVVYSKYYVDYVAPLLKAGSTCFVRGSVECRKYTDKEGQQRIGVGIHVNGINGSIDVITVPRTAASDNRSYDAGTVIEMADDDIPF